ncbi:transposase [Pontibacter pamirensis]|uniref:transposase n=1 Tax=Pontibacter pamirensis TaxID=2562824 RepID=UPI00138A32FD|nr:transposase [Pontibacter pamirensis]
MGKRIFDASFKRMAIDLSYARGSVKEVADELGIDPGRLSKWRQKDSSPVRSTEGLSDDQKEIKRLQKELKEAQMERDMDPMLTHVCGSKKAVSIFSKGDGRYTDS